MKKHEIKELINWVAVLAAPRSAGGHTDAMEAIFEGNAKVCASWVEKDYTGSEAFAYLFPDGTVVIMTDYFGSCAGCDAWEDATDDDVKLMVESLVNSSRVFDNAEEAYHFCLTETKTAEQYPVKEAAHLINDMEHVFKVWIISQGALDRFVRDYGWNDLEKMAEEHEEVAKLLANPNIKKLIDDNCGGFGGGSDET